jgi:hypothetical protein
MGKIIAVIIAILILCGCLFMGCTATGREMWNNWWYDVKVADDNTNYETLKKVEDTCRSFIASYNSDKLIYEQNKDSEDKELRNYAENAKMRANTTASNYNNYILKNEYIWKGNVPSDIAYQLPYIE